MSSFFVVRPRNIDNFQLQSLNHHSSNMSPPRTIWEDFASLSWPRYNVYKRANAALGGSIDSEQDLYLNEGVAADYQYVSVRREFV